MRLVKAVLLLGGLVGVVGLCASAATIPINNTGGSGWTIDGGTAYVTIGSPSLFPFTAWAADDATSQWISPQADYTGTNRDAGNLVYDYSVQFDLTGLDPSTAQLVFDAGFDNQLNDVLLNGTSIGFPTSPLVSTPCCLFPETDANGISISSGFISGTNTLTFEVFNAVNGTGGPTPTGLRVAFTTATADPASEIPEPSTLVLLGSALIGLGFMRRRRIPKS
jgi:PEP-CTERM motif